MNVNDETGYKGTVYFSKSMHYNFNVCSMEKLPENEYIILGQCNVDVQFADTRAAEIEAYGRLIAEEKQASHNRVQLMLGKIQELQALEVTK